MKSRYRPHHQYIYNFLMSFKISDALYIGNEEVPDSQSKFLSNVSKLHKNKSHLNVKKDIINPAPDQRNQPYKPEGKQHNKEKIQIFDQTITFPDQNQQMPNKTNIESSITEHSIIKIPEESTSPDSKSTSESILNQDPKIDYEVESYEDSILNPIHKLFECESQLNDLKKVKLKPLENLEQPPNQLFQIKSVNPILKKPELPKLDSTTTNESPLLLSEDFYYNKLVDQGKWSVIWDRDKIKNVPLIFDKSDKSLPINELKETIQNKQKEPKKWNSMNLLPNEEKFYSTLDVEVQSNDINSQSIQNSEVANSLTLIEPNITDFDHFHHPVYRPKLRDEMMVTKFHGSQKVDITDTFVLNSIEKLSAKYGDVYLIEHIFENQPFILNVGMNSLLITYLQKDEKFDTSTFSKDIQNTLKIIEPNEQSPFVAQLPLNQPVQAIYCPLFRMPISRHEKRKTDFLLIEDKRQKKFYINRFNEIFCARLLEPQREVMKPGSIKAQKFKDKFVEAVLINVFRGNEVMKQREKVTVSGLHRSYFPNMNEHKLRSFLKKYAEYKNDKGNGYWQLKRFTKSDLDEKFNHLKITPEDICSYQSMLYGLWRLKKNGVNILKCEPKIHNQINKLKGVRTKIIAEKIELELMKTPWMKTKNFIGAFQSNAIEIENADGETIFKKKSRRRENVEKRGKIEGTAKDLRKKTMDELNTLLAPYFTKDELDHMDRWKKVGYIREIAERKLQEDPQNEMAENFARKNDDYKNYHLKYKEYYQQSFENNLNLISSKNDENESTKNSNSAVVDDIEDDRFLNELNDLMNTKEDEEEEEEENFDEFVENPKVKNHLSLDPTELIPFGICTYPTKIDWKSFGLDPTKVKMRPVVKIIRVSLNKDKKVKVKIEWKRKQEEIKECKKKPNVYQDLSFVEKKKKKKKIHKNKNNDVILVEDKEENEEEEDRNNDVLITKDDKSDRLKLKISSNSMDKIKKAHKNYQNFKDNKNHRIK